MKNTYLVDILWFLFLVAIVVVGMWCIMLLQTTEIEGDMNSDGTLNLTDLSILAERVRSK